MIIPSVGTQGLGFCSPLSAATSRGVRSLAEPLAELPKSANVEEIQLQTIFSFAVTTWKKVMIPFLQHIVERGALQKAREGGGYLQPLDTAAGGQVEIKWK